MIEERHGRKLVELGWTDSKCTKQNTHINNETETHSRRHTDTLRAIVISC